jgi:hypothetical protein
MTGFNLDLSFYNWFLVIFYWNIFAIPFFICKESSSITEIVEKSKENFLVFSLKEDFSVF